MPFPSSGTQPEIGRINKQTSNFKKLDAGCRFSTSSRLMPVNITFYFSHVSFDSLVWPCNVTQVLHNALSQFNSTLGNRRMLFTTQNNGCIWKRTTDACSEFQASEMNPALHILNSLMFIYLFIFHYPPRCHHDFYCEWESLLCFTTFTFQTPIV